jgi:hypothetical protein
VYVTIVERSKCFEKVQIWPDNHAVIAAQLFLHTVFENDLLLLLLLRIQFSPFYNMPQLKCVLILIFVVVILGHPINVVAIFAKTQTNQK